MIWLLGLTAQWGKQLCPELTVFSRSTRVCGEALAQLCQLRLAQEEVALRESIFRVVEALGQFVAKGKTIFCREIFQQAICWENCMSNLFEFNTTGSAKKGKKERKEPHERERQFFQPSVQFVPWSAPDKGGLGPRGSSVDLGIPVSLRVCVSCRIEFTSCVNIYFL